MTTRKPDFSGWATKANLRCTDGRTITSQAFKHADGKKVPLVWQHLRNSPENILGHAILHARDEGVYTDAYTNDTPAGMAAKKLVQHGDISMFSIFANRLIEQSKQVMHGEIVEVSLVLAGANPGAVIDNVSIRHSDDSVETLEDEAVIYLGTIEHAEELEDDDLEDEDDEDSKDEREDPVGAQTVAHADGETIKDIYDAMSEDQKNVLHYMLGVALENAGVAHSDDDDNNIEHQEGTDMGRNVFDQNGSGSNTGGISLSHSDVKEIVAYAVKRGSLKDAVEDYALQHGIENMDVLFPDARNVTGTPEWEKRRTEWVASVLNDTNHTPVSRIKTLSADITQAEARAKGYIKGHFKKEEWFGLTKRTTGPTTVYKKQKLDRDDILDITDFDVVAWMKGEMRLMLEEELARAILIGDGREPDDEDKIRDPAGQTDGLGIRSIAHDHEVYAPTLYVAVPDSGANRWETIIDQMILARTLYRGSGSPKFYTSDAVIANLLLIRDTTGNRIYKTEGDLAAAMGVTRLVPVEVFDQEPDLLGIMVNLKDYNVGADKGGETTLFDDFDLDYNQLKYLYETRVSGALTKLRSAVVVRRVAAALALAVPQKPAFANNTITIPTVAGVTYTVDGVLTAAGPHAITADAHVKAVPAAGRYFADNVNDEWDYKFTSP